MTPQTARHEALVSQRCPQGRTSDAADAEPEDLDEAAYEDQGAAFTSRICGLVFWVDVFVVLMCGIFFCGCVVMTPHLSRILARFLL